MKENLAALAVIASLALVGCAPKALEVAPGPSVMPAIEPGDIPEPRAAEPAHEKNGPWTFNDVRVSGASEELETYALEALKSHASYYAGIYSGQYSKHQYEVNIGGVDEWQKILEVNASESGHVEFVLDNNYVSSSLEDLSSNVACELIRFGTEDEEALQGLETVTLTSSQSGQSGTFTNLDGC